MSRQPARPARILALGSAGAMPARAVSPPPVSSMPATVVVDLPVLNLRAAPRLSAPILRRLPHGSVLHALFYRASRLAVAAPDGTLGYVDRDDVRPLIAAPTAVAHAVTAIPSPAATRQPVRLPYLTVAATAATRRAAPAVSAPIRAVVPRRTPLALVEMRGTWARVATRDGRVGWVARYLTRPV